MESLPNDTLRVPALILGGMQRVAKESQAFVERDNELATLSVVGHDEDREHGNIHTISDLPKQDDRRAEFVGPSELGVVAFIGAAR